ncbi:high-affinity cGMP-specific 3-cyclic phosphodiesterase [Cyclospora cayetanensis]|uniref:Phosphodiesterase n=1 Tax=Cyclospora cayetanensis TaxID=88456 RepID=A0A1D3CZ18_9EIME|nr:high-affinity cGMP-specific 3-cyclic phosphodiesterase [Cyclospora cayetanensis]
MQVEWAEGAKSFATDTAGKPAFTLKTAHQEKTYEMFRKHDGSIDMDSRHIGLFHILLFVLISVIAATYANVYVSFAIYKNQVSLAEEEVYTELLGMRNVTVTIQRLEMLSHSTREYEAKALYHPNMLVPAYHRQVMAALFQINSRIIMGLEHIRSYDQSIRVATSCLYSTSKATNDCPLADVAEHLRVVDPNQEKALLNALMTVKLPLSEALDQNVLDLYPASWTAVTQPSQFVHALIEQGRFNDVISYSEKYVGELEKIIQALRVKVLWEPLIASAAVFGAVSFSILVLFAILTGIKSKRIYDASSVCQSAVFSSGKSLQTKMVDLSVFFMAFFEHLLLHNVHALNGLAALLLASDRLTAYHHKLLKLEEKALVDILTTCVNLIIYIETEVLGNDVCGVQMGYKREEGVALDLRSAVEKSVELFRPKAAANKIPISCTFANGCPSMAFIDQDKLMTTLTRTLAYVIDHSAEKGRGIDVYVNANASHHKGSKDRGETASPVLQLYDVRFEVKGHGVCMENTKAQMMVQTRGLIDRCGQGLRLLTCSRIAQSLGGFMQIQSSPSRGTFISFILRRKGRFSLEDMDKRFSSLGDLTAKVLTLSLSPETKQFFTFLSKDIGVTCLNCFCIRQLMEELKEDDPDCPVLAVFLGDFVKSSANPSDRFSRSMAPREIFGKLALHCADGNKGVKFAFVSAKHQKQLEEDAQQSSGPSPVCDNMRASTLLDNVSYRQLEMPLKTSDVIDVIVTAMEERMQQREERARAKSKLKVSYMMDVRKDSGESSLTSMDEEQVQQAQERLRSASFSRATSRARSTTGVMTPTLEASKGRGSRVTQAVNQVPAKFDPTLEDPSESGSSSTFVLLEEVEDEFLSEALGAREAIPESLREDANYALGVFNDIGFNKPIHELVSALLERASERPLASSRRFAGLMDVSIELANYYREMPGQRLLHKAMEDQRRETIAELTLKKERGEDVERLLANLENRRKETTSKEEPLAYKNSAPPPQKRRDPVWWMGSTAALKVQIPPNHIIQAQFNLASVSCFDGKPYTMHDLLDWDFHVLSLPEPEAVRLCRDLLVYYADRAALGIRGVVIMNFCGALHANYLQNPYHNFYHALNVVQVLCLLLALPDVGARFTPTDFFVLSVAALGHDLGHPGFNNLFMQRNQCWPARIYSNTSILENYHAASLLQILRVPHMDLFANMSDGELDSVRKRLINAIMWTDMAKHFDMVAKLDGKIQGEMVLSEGIMCTLQKPYLEGLLLHSADISNPLLEFDIVPTLHWNSLHEPYYHNLPACEQNKLEEALGQPPFMPALQSFDEFCIAKAQIGFIDFICKPLFNNLALMFPAQLGERAAQMRKNRQRWKHLADRNIPPTETPR